MTYYLDTSALVKLVIGEDESHALSSWMATRGRRPATSDLARTEFVRAIRRSDPDRLVDAYTVLSTLTITVLTAKLYEHAGRLDPTSLRSLDAIHLAAALDLGDDLEGLVTYDDRLAEAARANGIQVEAPRQPAGSLSR